MIWLILHSGKGLSVWHCVTKVWHFFQMWVWGVLSLPASLYLLSPWFSLSTKSISSEITQLPSYYIKLESREQVEVLFQMLFLIFFSLVIGDSIAFNPLAQTTLEPPEYMHLHLTLCRYPPYSRLIYIRPVRGFPECVTMASLNYSLGVLIVCTSYCTIVTSYISTVWIHITIPLLRCGHCFTRKFPPSMTEEAQFKLWSNLIQQTWSCGGCWILPHKRACSDSCHVIQPTQSWGRGLHPSWPCTPSILGAREPEEELSQPPKVNIKEAAQHTGASYQTLWNSYQRRTVPHNEAQASKQF